MKICYIDFEYIPQGQRVILVCAVLQTNDSPEPEKFWILGDVNQNLLLSDRLHKLSEGGYILVAFYIPAEMKCIWSLGIEPLMFQWLDAHIVGLPFYHSSYFYLKFSTGNYETEIPEEFFNEESTKATDYAYLESKTKASKRKSSSLLGFYHFFCQENIAGLVADKDANRDLILSLSPESETSEHIKEKILNYCLTDVIILRQLLEAQFIKWTEISNKPKKQLWLQFIEWSMFRARMVRVSDHGLPLNKELYDDLYSNYAQYVHDEQKALPQFFRLVEEKIYKSGKNKGKLRASKFVDCRNLFAEFVDKNNLAENWPKTPTGHYSRDERVLLDYNIIPEIAQYLAAKKRIKQIQFFKVDPKLNMPKIAKYTTVNPYQRSIWQHPDFGTFGTTTSRNAHRTESFIMGMERSLRAKLIGCPEGYELVVADYSAQEVWIAGALSGDENQLKAATIDPYMDFGKQIKIMPPDATKHSHGALRDVCKSVVLAGFYGMGIKALARKIQQNETVTKDIYKANKAYYATFFEWQKNYLHNHQHTHYYELADGWPLLDNCDHLGDYKVPPAMNFPIQGMGAVIMRKVVELFFQHGLKLIYTLHDEFAVLCYKDDKDKVTTLITELMQAACTHYFPMHTPPRVGFK